MSPTQRNILRAVADVIIPRTDTMPSAADLALTDAPCDAVLLTRPDLAAPLAAVLDRIAAMPASAAVPWLAENDSTAFHVLMQVTAGAYYAHRTVWALLGYSGQQPVRDNDLEKE